MLRTKLTAFTAVFSLALAGVAAGVRADPSDALVPGSQAALLDDLVTDGLDYRLAGVADVPDAPTAVLGVAGNRWATVRWTAPDSDGGSPITSYIATASPGGRTCATTDALHCTMVGLTNGTAYSFTVTARNAIGIGPASAPSAPVTPESPPTGEFTSLTPARILDTRTGLGRGGATAPLGTDQSIEVQITGQGGVAADGVSAVVMNVTVTQPTEPSYLTVWPSGTTRPTVSNLNYLAAQTVPNLVTVAVGEGGRVSAYNRFGTVHVIFDVVGFYADDSGPSGSRFHSIDNPYRYFDTRTGSGGVGVGPIGTDDSLRFDVLGKGGVPGSGVTAVVMNVTVTQPSQASYLTVSPGDVARPTASNLNYLAGVTVPNLVVVRVPSSGIVDFYNRFGTVHVLADVMGYFDNDRSGEAGRFVGLNPYRAFDSREAWGEPVCEDCGFTLSLAGWGGVPEVGAGAVVLNVTATQPSAPGYVTVFPDDLCQIPLASNLNFIAGQTVPNHVVARLSTPTGCADPDYPGAIYLSNRFGTVHVIVDIFGFYTDASSYWDWGTITDDTGAISIDVPTAWSDIYGGGWNDPLEPALVASPDLDGFFDDWDVPGIGIRATRAEAAIYPTPGEWLASRDFSWLDTVCATTDAGSYSFGAYVGEYVSGDGCGWGAGFLVAAVQEPGTDHFVIIDHTTIAPRDVDAVHRIIASLEVQPWP